MHNQQRVLWPGVDEFMNLANLVPDDTGMGNHVTGAVWRICHACDIPDASVPHFLGEVDVGDGQRRAPSAAQRAVSEFYQRGRRELWVSSERVHRRHCRRRRISAMAQTISD